MCIALEPSGRLAVPGGFYGKRILLLSRAFLIVGWATAPPGVEAISCHNVTNVAVLPTAGCDFGGLTVSNFNVSGGAGFTAATVGLGSFSTATPTNVNLIYQLSSTPGVGPGDVLLSYAVTAPAGIKLTGIDLMNDAIMGPVVIGEVACRVMFSPTGTCAPADRLAALTAYIKTSIRHRCRRRWLYQRLQRQRGHCSYPRARHAIAARQHVDGDGISLAEAQGR